MKRGSLLKKIKEYFFIKGGFINWKGLGTAIITPFKNGGEIDFEAFKKLLDHQQQGGVDYLVIAGTTGEGVTLTDSEIEELVLFAKKEVDMPIVLGVGSNNTDVVLNRIIKFNKLPIDAYLIVTPYYNKPNQAGLYKHYSVIAEKSDKDILVYNVPGRTGGKIMPTTFLRLALENKNIVGIKEASGDIDFAMNMYTTIEYSGLNRDIAFLSGDDMLASSLIGLGYTGLISVISNEFPKQMKKLISKALKNPHDARVLQYKLLEMMRANFIETNPVVVKYVMKKLGIGDGSVRMPLAELEDTKEIDEILDRLRI